MCVEFVKDNLFNEVIKDPLFAEGNFKQALTNACVRLEKNFFEKIQKEFDNVDPESSYDNKIERSGTCATIIMFVNRVCFLAQLGDSRCVLSKDKG